MRGPAVAESASQIAAASDAVQVHLKEPPQTGIVLGTGANLVADQIRQATEIDYVDIPNFPASTSIGHAGKLICGTLRGQSVLAMSGRFHMYEGYSPSQVALPIAVMSQLGVRRLIITNAAGGVHPHFNVGELMLINGHIDLMFRANHFGCDQLLVDRPAIRADLPYDAQMMSAAQEVANRENRPLHRGIYVGMLGPNYETRAEYAMVRSIGGDAVGMSTIPEVTVASHLAMRVMAISIITNVAQADAEVPTSGHGVIDAAQIAAPLLAKIVSTVISE